MEPTVKVGSRVIISCGKQSSTLTRLISGIVRKRGFSRGADSKVLYTISGTSTGIRLNERLAYIISEAAKLDNGQIDFSDASRKVDTLLALGLNPFTAEGILSISNLASNSDVETFVASTNIQYGELQDLVNYYEDQSGGEVIVDTNDLVSFRYEIKNNFFGKGFTLKNKNTSTTQTTDDADDTMYLVNKNWSYEDDFYKSSNYGNRFYALLPAENVPSTREEIGYTSAGQSADVIPTQEIAAKFRPPHTLFLPGDIIIVGGQSNDPGGFLNSLTIRFRICEDSGGFPQNAGGVVANIDFLPDQFDNPIIPRVASVEPQEVYKVLSQQIFYNSSNARIDEFYLDTTRDYWLIASNTNFVSGHANWFHWGRNPNEFGTFGVHGGSGYSTNSAGGSGWSVFPGTGKMCFAMPRRRSNSFALYDPKAMQAVSDGLTAGLATDTLLTDAPIQVTTFDSMYRFIQQQTYNLARPRTTYNFPTVTAPNIPIFPGDPIVVSDNILGFSTAGNKVVLTTCGDMSYQWGNMGSGSYDAPTKLSINAIGVHQRYR
jgi:hypothetical protein